jgi:hypothetical protein
MQDTSSTEGLSIALSHPPFLVELLVKELGREAAIQVDACRRSQLPELIVFHYSCWALG